MIFIALSFLLKLAECFQNIAPQNNNAYISSISSISSNQQKSKSCLFSTSSPTEPSTIDNSYYSSAQMPSFPTANSYGGHKRRITLTRFLSQYVKDHPEYKTLKNIYLAVQMACKTISQLVNRAGLVLDTTSSFTTQDDGSSDFSDGRYYSMKRLDKLSTTVMKNALKFTGTVQMVVPEAKMGSEQPEEHQPGVLIAYDKHHLACLDPMDGSGNQDAGICTGTIFGVYDRPEEPLQEDTSSEEVDDQHLLENILQPARNMRAAGYCIYSSATVLVLTLGEGVYGFTLDPQINEFVLTHENVTIPQRGNVYSCNEANSEGWKNEGWKEYLRNLKLGLGESKKQYAHRYVGSMVGDIHRTLLYGGIFAYPASTQRTQGNLQLLYKTSPLAFVVDQAGGKAMDEDGNDLLDKKPARIHQKSPCFMGSPRDMEELKNYLQKEPSQ